MTGRLDQLRRLRGPTVANFTSRVRTVVVVASSSRGGSSMVTELLRHSRGLLHLRAEFNPFLRLVGLGYPDSGAGSDQLGSEHVYRMAPSDRQLLDDELSLDTGAPTETIDDDEQFAWDLVWRLSIQWPELDIDPVDCGRLVRRLLDRMRREQGWQPRELRDPSGFQQVLLAELQRRGLAVNPWYYDLPRTLVRRTAVMAAPPGAPGDLLIEEPPFILPQAWRRVRESDLGHRPLVIKTPSNAYRMGFLRQLFPNARFKVLHLTRNPGAAINGLYDGWRHHGFHAHRMPEPLRIRGYADSRPADRRWWKFDLPPDWRGYTAASLPEVCAFQWRSCHQAILQEVGGDGAGYHRLRYEDLIQAEDRRAAVVGRLARWLEVPFDGAFARVARAGVRPVVTTEPPSPRRWRARAELIRPAITGEVRALAEELGYGVEDQWI